MVKNYFIILAFIFSFSAYSQTTLIAIQDFEATSPEWNFTRDVAFFDNNTDGFFGIHDGDTDNDSNDTGFSVKANNITFENITNDFLFIHDLNNKDGNGTPGEATIAFENMDVKNYFDVEITFDYQVFEFENADYIKYQIIEDGLITVNDTLTRNGEGSISFRIQNKTATVSLKLIIRQNALDDYAAIDNLKLEGKVIIPCNDLMISEYVEGNSSTGYRNNYIELYNPTSAAINLENYSLVKYTKDSQNISNILNLTGNIPAFGIFLIEDITENLGVTANMPTNNAVMDFTGDDKIALRNSVTIIDLIGIIGDSNNFAKDVTLRRKSNVESPNNEFNPAEWDIYELENIKNLNQHVSVCSSSIPEIEVSGNFNPIQDETSTSSPFNNTYFGGITAGSGEIISKNFTIKNTGTANLTITNIEINGADANQFTLENNFTGNIVSNDSISFTINFETLLQGIKSAKVKITNDDDSENPFQFLVQAEGTGFSGSPLLISQYYEGNGNDKWIEVTNISASATPDNMYYLALYFNEAALDPIGKNPDSNKVIPALQPGETINFSSTFTLNNPVYAKDENKITTQVCRFNGDDIVVISTSNDRNCWGNRIDIIGNSSNWGENKSFVRKYGCEEALPKTAYDISDWLNFDISDINIANTGFNSRLGEHYTGSTSFEITNNWQNGFPDIYRDVIINSHYDTNSFSNFEACTLTINNGKVVEIGAGNHITIYSDLTVNGALNVLHEGSLLMLSPTGMTVNNGEINIHKTTTSLKKFDYTYWSSPITNAALETVFHASPQNSFYEFVAQNYIDINEDNQADNENAWRRASGEMIVGRGYTAMAPNTNPFINTQSVIFSGNVNNGHIEVPVYLSADSFYTTDDWNLIGNPYPSAIDADLFLNHQQNTGAIGGSIYLWTHNSSPQENIYTADDYAMFTVGTGGIAAFSEGEIPTGKIASGQGFFVEATQEGNLIFTNEMRTNEGNNNFFKTSNSKENRTETSNKIWLNLFNDAGAFNQILIGFLEGASESIESKFDGYRFEGNNFISFYSMADQEKLAIQGTKPWQGDEIIDLGYSSYIQEKITLKIGIDHIEGELKNEDIFLLDKLLNKIHDLKLEDYVFQTENEGVYNDRFSLQFNNGILAVNTPIDQEEILLVKNEQDYLSIKTSKNSMLNSIKIYDVLGRKIKEQNTKNKEYILNKNIFNQTGVYILHVQLENSSVLVKKIIP